MTKFRIKVPQTIFNQIKSIQDYIQNVLLNPTAAKKTTQSILKGIKSLEYFPERGFDADEKIGKPLSQSHQTRGILIVNRKYLLLYSVDQEEKVVKISHLIPVKTDYVTQLFLSLPPNDAD